MQSASTQNVRQPPTVQLHALSAGHFALPEEQFVCPASPGARRTVPSLSFLLQHECPSTRRTTRIVFDLGLRRDTARYPQPIQNHIQTRQPLTTDPDVVKSLRHGGLSPDDIDYVMYSHVHWDHVGEPRDFPRSTFVVGNGSLDVLHGRSVTLRGNHSFFEADLLDPTRTIELSDPGSKEESSAHTGTPNGSSPHSIFSKPWQALDHLPSVLDIFGDGSLYIVDAPGHLPGHINLLARVADTNAPSGTRFVYLAGDACHDRRILCNEKEIGEWDDAQGHRCCIHADRPKAEETIQRIRVLESQGAEVILAHDSDWEGNERNRSRFFGASPATPKAKLS